MSEGRARPATPPLPVAAPVLPQQLPAPEPAQPPSNTDVNAVLQLKQTVHRLETEVMAQVDTIRKLSEDNQRLRSQVERCTCNGKPPAPRRDTAHPTKRDYPDQAKDLAWAVRSTTPSPADAMLAELETELAHSMQRCEGNSEQSTVNLPAEDVQRMHSLIAQHAAENGRLKVPPAVSPSHSPLSRPVVAVLPQEKLKAYQLHVQMLTQQAQAQVAQQLAPLPQAPLGPVVINGYIPGGDACCPQKSKRIAQQQRLIEEKAELVRTLREVRHLAVQSAVSWPPLVVCFVRFVHRSLWQGRRSSCLLHWRRTWSWSRCGTA